MTAAGQDEMALLQQAVRLREQYSKEQALLTQRMAALDEFIRSFPARGIASAAHKAVLAPSSEADAPMEAAPALAPASGQGTRSAQEFKPRTEGGLLRAHIERVFAEAADTGLTIADVWRTTGGHLQTVGKEVRALVRQERLQVAGSVGSARLYTATAQPRATGMTTAPEQGAASD